MKTLLPVLFVAASLLGGCSKKEDPSPTPTTQNTAAAVTVKEGAGAAYTLDKATVTATYQLSAEVTVIGFMKDGQRLLVKFYNVSTNTSLTDTKDLDVYIGAEQATISATKGTTTSNRTNKTVSGSFSATFKSGQVVSGSFTDVKL